MANQSGGPGSYSGTGNTFNGAGTGSYTLAGDGFLGLTGNAAATVVNGTIANITLGASVVGTGVATLTTATITALSGGTANIASVVGSIGTTVLHAAGGTVSVGSAVTGLGTLNATIDGGGQLNVFNSLLSGASGDTVGFGSGGGTFAIDTTTLSVSVLSGTVIGNFGVGDHIIDQNINFANVASYSVAANGPQTVTFFNSAGAALGGLSFAAGTFASTGQFAAGSGPVQITNSGAALELSTCFLRGTMIATPHSERSVESLRCGEAVHVLENGRLIAKPILWIGSRAIDAHALRDRDEAYPIRIRRHAFDTNAPHRDLLLTPEHCILTEAGLTPVRMFVNGSSIVIDRTVPRYEFFHIELDRHGILLSEGLTTESYLDTGNRDLFVDAGTAVTLRRDVVMAAPLAVSRAEIEPIWQRLAERARELGFAAPASGTALTDQPDLRLLLESGRELRARWHNGQRHMFQLPRGEKAVRLLSRAAVPAQVIGPFVDDRRSLGVAVERIVVWRGLEDQVLAATDLALAGWHEPEGAVRWTDGDAALDLGRAEDDTFLDVHVTGTFLYALDQAADQRAAA